MEVGALGAWGRKCSRVWDLRRKGLGEEERSGAFERRAKRNRMSTPDEYDEYAPQARSTRMHSGWSFKVGERMSKGEGKSERHAFEVTIGRTYY